LLLLRDALCLAPPTTTDDGLIIVVGAANAHAYLNNNNGEKKHTHKVVLLAIKETVTLNQKPCHEKCLLLHYFTNSFGCDQQL